MSRIAEDLTGRRFARLTVLSRAPNKGSKAVWNCCCDCGRECLAHGQDLRSGRHRSCGCLHREIITKHDGLGTPTYLSWQSMKARCKNPNTPKWHLYGGRGITVCERWRDFAAFLADMGERPADTTLERIDGNGNYEPGNCRWATKKEQGNNTSRNHLLTHRGETRTVTEWARYLGWSPDLLRGRLKLGWSEEEALTTPRMPARERSSGGQFQKRR